MLIKAFITVCILPLIFLFSAGPEKAPPSTPDDLPVVTGMTGIGYGKPVAECDGSGICLVSEDIMGRFPMDDNYGAAQLTIGKGGMVTRMMASSRSMTQATIKKHFSGKHFIMDDPYEGSLKMDGKNLKITIPAGKHRIKKTKNGFLLDIIRG